MRHLRLTLCLTLSLILLSCGAGIEERMRQKAADNIRSSVAHPDSLILQGFSKADSCFGDRYFSDEEIDAIYTVMEDVTEHIMHSTNNMTEYDSNDLSTNELVERHMQASMSLNDITMLPQSENTAFTGWKIKADYETVSSSGSHYKAERWFFFDKEGKTLLKTFELPLP